MKSTMLSKNVLLSRLIQFVPVVGFTVLVVGSSLPLLTTALRPIDDHEYVAFELLNPSHNFVDAAVDGWERAIREFGSARWRPAYYVGRAITTSLLSEATAPRYVLRLLFAVGVVTLLSNVIVKVFSTRKISPIDRVGLSFLIGHALLLLGGWGDVVARLGPQEIFGLLGVAVLASVAAAPDQRLRWLWAAVGTYLCTFKENFAIISAFLLVVIILCKPAPATSRKFKLLLVFSAAWSVVVLSSIWLNGGNDVYGGSVSLQNQILILPDFVRSPWFITSVLFSFLAWVFGSPDSRVKVECFGLLSVIVLFSERAVYGRHFLGIERYQSLSNIVMVLQFGALVTVCFDRLLSGDRQRLRVRAMRATIWLTASALTLGVISDWHDTASAARSEAAEWDRALNAYSQAVAERDSAGLMIIVDLYAAQHLGRYETSLSLSKFLSRGEGSDRDRFLAVQALPAGIEEADRSVAGLRLSLLRLSESGSLDPWRVGAPVAPLSSLPKSGEMVCVHMSSSGRAHGFESVCSETFRM